MKALRGLVILSALTVAFVCVAVLAQSAGSSFLASRVTRNVQAEKPQALTEKERLANKTVVPWALVMDLVHETHRSHEEVAREHGKTVRFVVASADASQTVTALGGFSAISIVTGGLVAVALVFMLKGNKDER